MATLFKAHTLGLCSVREVFLRPIGWSLRAFSFLSIVQNKPVSWSGLFRGFTTRFSSQIKRPLPAAKNSLEDKITFVEKLLLTEKCKREGDLSTYMYQLFLCSQMLM